LSWLVILPAGLWAIAILYIPILGASLNALQTWMAAGLSAVLVIGSVLGHSLAHLLAARLVGDEIPEQLTIFIYGEAAQVWPASQSTRREILTTAAGSIFNLFLAFIAYVIWNAQLTPILNVSMPFWGLYNLWLALANLTPAFPLDGGRFTRAFLWGLMKHPVQVKQTGIVIGAAVAAFQVAWGAFLIAQGYRYSLETGGLSIAPAFLLVLGLARQPAWRWGHPDEKTSGAPNLLRMLPVGLSLCALLVLSSSLLLTNYGVETPGLALSVEPMVEVPAQYRQTPKGTFILTSVVQQSPIPAGVWYAARLIPSFKILPPEKKLPNQPSPQENARQGFRMLDQSEITAVAVGLKKAGFSATIINRGVAVGSILPGSPSEGLLQIGDIIQAFEGNLIQNTDQLIQLVKAQDISVPAHLKVKRGNQTLDITIPPLGPGAPKGSPRLGISLVSAGFDYQLPIPVKIVPQKIVGGPSAGLMFTLTVDNLLSPTDLTGGRKIAGTGTIEPDGTVGPIGGVELKVVAAELAGASIFFSPAENYADALAAAHSIRVVKVENVDQAIAFLHSLPPQ
jgi:PDZ domain-containing protein